MPVTATKHRTHRIGLQAIAILLFVAATRAVDAKEMNFLFILVDDWGCADAGILGSDFFETPYIDRFADSGLRFTNAYAASPVCSPTRAAILTGKSPARLNMTIWHEGAVEGGPPNRKLLEPRAEPNLARSEVTLADRFKQSGYFTAHIGKWHLGKAAYYPETQGYDLNIGGTYWGAPATFFYPYRGVWSESDPELRYVPVGLGKPGDYLTDQLTNHAIDVIRQRNDQPFFLSLWFHAVHTPIEGKPDLVRNFQNKTPGKIHRHPEYAAMLKTVDDNIGRLLRELDQQNLADSTVVILTSDNGGVDFATSKTGDRVPTNNLPFRSGKGTLYEGGIRVPLMIRWPGLTQPETLCAEPVTSQDFFPTLTQWLGDESVNISDLDGKSLLPLIRDPKSKLNRELLGWHFPHYYPRMTPGSAIRQKQWKLIHFYEDDRVELYDLQADPGEAVDLSVTQPQRAMELREKLDQWRRAMGANAPSVKP